MTSYRKYGNVRTEVDGISFASKREAKRWQELRFLEQHGHISQLVRQVPYDIWVEGVKITRYVSDFNYFENGEVVVSDAKGYKTPEYMIKKRLMKAVFGIDILEV